MKKILIAKISSAFGIKGEVKIISYCQNPLDLEKYTLFDEQENFYKIKISNKNKTVIGTTKDGGSIFIAKISDIDNREKAEKLRAKELFVNRENLKKLAKNEFYHVDLIGLNVIDEQNNKIGKVLGILDFGGGIAVEIEFSNNNETREENFPFKNEFFGDVDLEKGNIVFKNVI